MDEKGNSGSGQRERQSESLYQSPIPPNDQTVLGAGETQRSEKRVEETERLLQDTRTIEWLQFATNVILAGIGVFALVIYGGQLRVMKGQLNEIIRQYPDIHAQAVAATAALQESTKAFRIDERAWIEIEPIKPELRPPKTRSFPLSLSAISIPRMSEKL